jgi:hypothetical protein
MSGNEFFYPIIAAVTTITLRYVNKATNKNISTDVTRKYSLRIHRLYQIIGYAGLALCLILLIGPLFMPEEMNIASYIILLCCYLIFGGLGLLCTRYYNNHLVIFDDALIQVLSVSGVVKFMKWEDINTARFNAFTGLITISDQVGNKIKIHQHLVGLTKFLNLLKAKTGLTAEKIKLPGNI